MRRHVGFALGVLGMATAAAVAVPTLLDGGGVSNGHGAATGFLLSAAVAFVCVATGPSGESGTTAAGHGRLRRPLRLCFGLAVGLVALCAAVDASVAVPGGVAAAAAVGLLLLRSVAGLRRLDRRRRRSPERDVLSGEEFVRAGFDD